MPVVEAGFVDEGGKPDKGRLLLFGPTLQVSVNHMAVDGAELPAEPESVYALVDTGATESCIDASLAEKLELPIVDVRTISGAAGSNQHYVYMAEVHIPSIDFGQYGQFTGVGLSQGGQEHSVLLGRTFLENTIMIYDGLKGHVTLTR